MVFRCKCVAIQLVFGELNDNFLRARVLYGQNIFRELVRSVSVVIRVYLW